MRLVSAAIILALAFSGSHAAELDFGGTTITVPTPSGFARLTPDIQPLYDVSMDMVASTNVRLATFVDENIIPRALAGEMPTFEKYINVETMLQLRSSKVTATDFSEFKRSYRQNIEETIAQLNLKLPEGMARISEDVSETLDLDVALSVSNMVPLPIHHESDRTMASSSIVKYGIVAEEQGKEITVTSTTTFVFLKGKLFFVYVYGGPNDLDWTRSQAARWIDSIIAANAYTPADHRAEQQTRRKGIDWSSVMAKGVGAGLVGGLLGGAFGLFSWIGRRRKKKGHPTL